MGLVPTGYNGSMPDLRVTSSVSIPEHELEVSFARSGGPGGQHVNTSATKVELRFDVAATEALSDEQKERVRDALGGRMTDDGVLILTASEYRSQTRNREAVHARLVNLLGEALRPQKRRRPTRPPRASKERRLENKRRRSELKESRKPPR